MHERPRGLRKKSTWRQKKHVSVCKMVTRVGRQQTRRIVTIFRNPRESFVNCDLRESLKAREGERELFRSDVAAILANLKENMKIRAVVGFSGNVELLRDVSRRSLQALAIRNEFAYREGFAR